MSTFSRTRITALAPAPVFIVVAGALLGGCASREQRPHYVMHDPVMGKPQSIFVDPVGYQYPDIVQRTRPSDYKPLPPVRRPFETNPPATEPAARPLNPTLVPEGPASDPLQKLQKSVRLPQRPAGLQTAREPAVAMPPPADIAGAPANPTPLSPVLPTVEIVPASDVEGRASRQFRR